MAKTKKADEKTKAGATLEIDVDSFVRTRDSVRPPFLPFHLPVFLDRDLDAAISRFLHLTSPRRR